MLEFKLGQEKKEKKKPQKEQEGCGKSSSFSPSSRKRNNDIDSFGGKTLENSRTVVLTVELCFPLCLACPWQLRAETAP